ncbi:hypothetical protein ALP8811_02515 [Aliiroseovarius pelagivivens]|uniref:DUF6473 domain-containing protein n=1 Tax=Aliiroseovarius pelagivivens TaxID=1639690 RepID=A0A2R8AR84_9RHOB|nr:DUF6473 family protein [Aliiroseovarius pelagivivens]SPF78586.1 hypothetical protein ALP8811_02515 [Aliiroseovarius pelagivivens]
MAYDILGKGALDYFPCRYKTSKILFRGPKRDLSGPYVAVLGGTETYGRFMEHPYPELLEADLGRVVVNFGCPNAGLDVFLHDPMLLKLCNSATDIVIQLPGAQNLSNRFYAVHPRRNDRFLRASSMLKYLYPELDFTDYHFTRHLLGALQSTCGQRFDVVRKELKQAWVGRMKGLLSRLDKRATLVWMSDHSIGDQANDALGSDPLFVDRDMVEDVRPFVRDLVEVVLTPDEIAVGQQGLVHSEMDVAAAHMMLGTLAHERAARKLLDSLSNHRL